MPIHTLNHINISADRATLDAVKKFYCDVLGLTEGHRPPFSRFGYWLYAGEFALVHLVESREGEERELDAVNTFDHFAFDCTDRTGMEATLIAHGVAFETAHVPATRQVQLFVKDPAGNKLELNFASPADVG